MKTNNTESGNIKQAFSTQRLLEIDFHNKERYRLSKLKQAAQPTHKLSASDMLEIKYSKLAPIAKMILNQLDSRNLKWSANPFNQQWLADSCDCTLRWVRHCISRLAEEGFISIVRINRGKPYKTPTGWFKYPNIYIVSPFLRWATSAKLYSLITAKAEKIQAQFLYYRIFLIKYYKDRDTLATKTPFAKISLATLLKKVMPLTG